MASIFDEQNPSEFYEIMPINLNEFINSKNRKKRDADESYEFTFDHDNYNSDQNDHAIFKRSSSSYEDLSLVEKLSNFEKIDMS